MRTQNPSRCIALLILAGFVLLILSCTVNPVAAWTVTGSPGGPGIGDYGDAPDSMLHMNTGYYGFAGRGFGPYFLVPLGVLSSFPTIEANNGPYTNDVDDFGFSNPGSMEDDATDPLDPDGNPNLDTLSGFADFDTDDGTVILVILMVSAPPPAIVFTFANSGYETSAYWNFAIDVDQSGSWDYLEWISVDKLVNLFPGPNFLVSDWFRMGTYGGGFGRLKLPVWGRNMITNVPVTGNVPLHGSPPHWDGSGMSGGFPIGEVEDYFFEWRPIGQKFEDSVKVDEPEKTVSRQFENLVHIKSPEQIEIGQKTECVVEGPKAEEFLIVYFPDSSSSNTIYTKIAPGERATIESEDSFIQINTSSKLVTLEIERARKGSRLLLVGLTKDNNRKKEHSSQRIAGGTLVGIVD